MRVAFVPNPDAATRRAGAAVSGTITCCVSAWKVLAGRTGLPWSRWRCLDKTIRQTTAPQEEGWRKAGDGRVAGPDRRERETGRAAEEPGCAGAGQCGPRRNNPRVRAGPGGAEADGQEERVASAKLSLLILGTHVNVPGLGRRGSPNPNLVTPASCAPGAHASKCTSAAWAAPHLGDGGTVRFPKRSRNGPHITLTDGSRRPSRCP